jgi:arsenate reductase
MREIGIDISKQQPKHLKDALSPDVALVVGLCAEEACPVVPGAESTHWPLLDPAGHEIGFYRQIRDDLRGRIADLIEGLK